jgi:hypothetical protein
MPISLAAAGIADWRMGGSWGQAAFFGTVALLILIGFLLGANPLA